MMSDLPLFEQMPFHVRSSDSFVNGKAARAVHYTFQNISQVQEYHWLLKEGKIIVLHVAFQ